MKRFLLLIGLVMLFGCGMLQTARTPAAVNAVGSKVIFDSKETVQKHVSAFSAEDLYRSRAEKLRRNRRREAKTPQEVADEIVEEPVSEKTITEIIQIVDEKGNVVASKKVQ